MSDEFPPFAFDDDVGAVYGKPGTGLDLRNTVLSKDFAPWHHPVKQIVRQHQWVKLTEELINSYPNWNDNVLRYFTLPGKDLLDIRALAPMCRNKGLQIEYFGFDSDPTRSESAVAESGLRQAGLITADALVLTDRLEEIARSASPAAEQLKLRRHFNVVNIDACAHLAYQPEKQAESTFDAICALLAHQLKADSSWLLFITTRVEPSLMEGPGDLFRKAIVENLRVNIDGFKTELATAIGATVDSIENDVNDVWAKPGHDFLKLYTIGLGKFLLQFYNAQQNMPTKVELASVYAYRVHGADPDMLALAFRISPQGIRILPASVGGTANLPNLEPVRAIHMAKRAQKLTDLDVALQQEPDVREAAIRGTVELLALSNYSIPDWRAWLASHPERPVIVSDTEMLSLN